MEEGLRRRTVPALFVIFAAARHGPAALPELAAASPRRLEAAFNGPIFG
ncbi:hypothetical protein ACKI2N_019430 [Cupriavidus sp. 30B13]